MAGHRPGTRGQQTRLGWGRGLSAGLTSWPGKPGGAVESAALGDDGGAVPAALFAAALFAPMFFTASGAASGAPQNVTAVAGLAAVDGSRWDAEKPAMGIPRQAAEIARISAAPPQRAALGASAAAASADHLGAAAAAAAGEPLGYICQEPGAQILRLKRTPRAPSTSRNLAMVARR